MGSAYRTPCENLRITHCLMENGHGAVTIGSEMAGGVRGLTVEDCLFRHTDRGLRIKTRRGRGEQAVVEDVYFHRLVMEGVKAPFTANCFYFCDPDGKSDYVQCRESSPWTSAPRRYAPCALRTSAAGTPRRPRPASWACRKNPLGSLR